MPTDLKKYLPKIYDAFIETDALISAENRMFNELEHTSLRVWANQFVITADIEGIEMFEKLLRIIANPDTEDLEFRRQRILNRLSLRSPYTLPWLRQKLDQIIGVGKYSIDMQYDNFLLIIESFSEDQLWFDEIYFMINNIKPANIVFKNKPVIVDDILISEEVNRLDVIYNYKLGSWSLGEKPFVTITGKEAIKMPNASSIQPPLLRDVTLKVVEVVNSVRINGAFIIANFAIKQANDNTAVLGYILPLSSGISEITKVELLDVNGTTLTLSNVYVQVVDNITIEHRISSREGV